MQTALADLPPTSLFGLVTAALRSGLRIYVAAVRDPLTDEDRNHLGI
jgi:hypothetical protein